MTSNEFRGFIANFMIQGTVWGLLIYDTPHWPFWGFIILGILMFLAFPLTGYHPTQAQLAAENLRKLGAMPERNNVE